MLAPEHPLVAQITQPSCKDQVEEYVESTLLKTDRERTVVEGKTGVGHWSPGHESGQW